MLSCSIWFSVPSFWMGGGLESRCVGRVCGVDDPHLKHELRSGSQDHHPSKNSVQKTISCNSTSNAPDYGRMYPKHVELRIHQQITLLHQVGISNYLMRIFTVKQPLRYLSGFVECLCSASVFTLHIRIPALQLKATAYVTS